MKQPYPWQQAAWEQLYQAWQQQRLGHALLLTGSTGMGKVDFARCFAQRLLCKNTFQHFACGHCQNCHLFAQNHHPDYFEVTQSEGSKVIRVEQIRQLSDQLHQTPHTADYQIVLLFPAQSLNLAAANALLKTLEEPMGQVLIMLIADQISTLPATIISRCQRLCFNTSVNHQQATQWLCEQPQTTADMAALWLSLAGHAPIYAQQLDHSNYLLLRNQVLTNLLDIKSSPLNLLTVAQTWSALEPKLLLYALITLMIDTIRLHYRVSTPTLYHIDQVDMLRKLTKRVNLMQLVQLLSHLMGLQRIVLTNTPLNWQLCLEQWLLEWQQGALYAS